MDLGSIYEHAKIGILVVDSHGIIEFVNRFTEEIFGFDRSELIGQPIEILVPSASRGAHIAMRDSFMEHSSPRPMGEGRDLHGQRKDGVEIPIEISLSPIKEDGKVRIAAFISDISIRKQAEFALKESEEKLQKLNTHLEAMVSERTHDLADALIELQETYASLESQMAITMRAEEDARKALAKEQELSELKSRFVSMASHEFRTPLTSILSSASLIEKYIEAGKAENSAKHINRIKSSVRNLTGILNDFLSLEKLRSGKVNVVEEPCQVRELCQEVVEEVQVVLKPGQSVNFQHLGTNPEVNIDPHAFRNVVTNLLSNAVKYSLDGQKIEILSEVAGDLVRVKVSDQGIGIPENEQVHLFNRFFRAKNAQNITGTGLGLHLVSHYLDLMGGTISFQSKENQGTTFQFEIPTH